MIQAATMFGGGVWACQKLGELPLPTFQRAVNEGEAFKLRVRLHSASTPGLAEPGVLTQERPRIGVVVGRARKDTEFGDFQGRPRAGDSSPQLPWRFNETLTFSASVADVLGAGIQVWLKAQSDVRLGPLQVSMSQPRSIGMCSVDFRKRVLPELAATGGAGSPGGSSSRWETPPLSFPLTYVGGGDSEHSLGEVVGNVSISFSMDVDPGDIQSTIDASTKSLLHRVTDPVRDWIEKADPAKWAADAGVVAGCDMIKERCRQIDVAALADAASCDMVRERCRRIDVGSLADGAGCDMVKDRCRQIDVGKLADAAGRRVGVQALADAGCGAVRDGRPARHIEPGTPPRAPSPGRKCSLGSARTAARSLSGSSLSSGASSAGSPDAGKRPAAAAARAAPMVAPPVYIYKMPAATSAGVPGSVSFNAGGAAPRVVGSPGPKSGPGAAHAVASSQPGAAAPASEGKDE